MKSTWQHWDRFFTKRLGVVAAVVAILFLSGAARMESAAGAPTYTVLLTFGGTRGVFPSSTLLRDAAGNLYGTTVEGGARPCGIHGVGCGTVFKLDPLGYETLLYAFKNGADGAGPSGLTQDAAGNFYGTAGGGTSGLGEVFELSASGTLTVLYSFKGGTDGQLPEYGVIRDANGNFYGTTYNGGDNACEPGYGCGTVFKLDSAGNETVLYSFTDGTGGGFVSSGVIRDAAGNLYGTAQIGGDLSCSLNGVFAGCGVVFKVDPSGHESVLHAFTGGTDGGYPFGGVVQDAAGNLYGTAAYGGDTASCDPPYGCGVVYKLDSSGNETVLFAFTGPTSGQIPYAGVIQDSTGNLYGTTLEGGDAKCSPPSGCGTVFELDTSGHETVLYAIRDLKQGITPLWILLLDPAGNLYGSAKFGGDSKCHNNLENGCGTVFKVSRP